MIETIHIYHTNDLHSHFEKWPKITEYISKRRNFHQKHNEKVFLFDIGDHMDRFHPISEAFDGIKNVELLNHLGYDAVTIGNNEGITLPFDGLNAMYDNATFHVLIANLFDNGNYPSWAKPYHIYTLESGIKIAVVGLTVYYHIFYKLLGWEIKDPIDALKHITQKVRQEVDAIILLSHLGINEDESIAEQFPEIDIILGGHTHHLFPSGKHINHTLLCCAGKYGDYIGYATLKIDTRKRAILQKTATVINTDQLVEESEFAKSLLAGYFKESEQILGEVVAYLPETLSIDWFNDSPLSTLLADALREWCDCEISMVNAGVLLGALKEGPVTLFDLHNICPHPINPCRVELEGDELKEIILQAQTEKMEQLEIKGLGFRGKIMGKMIYNGIDMETTTLSDGLRHVTKILINGEPIDPKRKYTVATIDMFTFGRMFPEIRDAKEKKFFMPEMLRDVLREKLQKEFS